MQVSLWEGDATFHNIDLNVDALNDELQSSLTFTSGYIHDLTIHVPWTKLMSEPVTISVNTIGKLGWSKHSKVCGILL